MTHSCLTLGQGNNEAVHGLSQRNLATEAAGFGALTSGNMVCQPLPRPHRLVALGRAVRAAIASYPSDERVVVVATGGMSHQISGTRFGIANEQLDRTFLDLLPGHLDELVDVPVLELMRVGGTEAAELILWYAMRAALADDAEVMCSFQTFPSITGCGALAMKEPVQ